MSDAMKLTPLEQQQMALLAKLLKHQSENKLESYRPWPKQMEFHAAGKTHRERLFRAINQCLTPDTPIRTGVGERLISELLGEPGFDVRAWDGESLCVAPASSLFLRGIERAFRIHLDNGEVFECSHRHRVLGIDGCWHTLDQLIRGASGWRYHRTIQDSTASCGADGRPCDLELPLGAGSDRRQLPSITDARTHIRSSENRDAWARTLAHTHSCRDGDLLTTAVDDPTLLSDLFESFAVRDAECDVGLSPSDIRALWQSHHESSLPTEEGRAWTRQAESEDVAFADIFLLARHSPLTGSTRILAVEEIGYKPIVSFEVYRYHNYEVGGVISANCGKSFSGAMEDAMHASGRYPDWWPGYRFNRKTKGWILSESMQFSRDNMQRLLLGDVGSEGTGTIPKRDIVDIIKSPHSVAGTVDTILVKSQFGGNSKIMFKSAEVERNKLGGDTIDWAHADEEAPMPHYEEVLTRTNIVSGPVWTTFTPLRGSTNLVNRFLIERAMGTIDICWTIDDASHYTPEQKAAMREQYKNSPQRDARLYAKPVLGSGAVFPLSKDKISVEPFPIPDHWPRICGFDFGWTHPTAMAWWAIDRDTGIAYLYDVYAATETLVSAHAGVWKSRGDWIRVAWPADGDNETMQGGGVALANQYRSEGVKMLMEPAMLPETNTKGEKITNRKSVEAQIQLMNDDMARGKIKVFSHLSAFWKEYDLYHRDENGKIVKKGEDICSAVRYAYAMRRFAKTRTEMNPVRIPAAEYSDRV